MRPEQLVFLVPIIGSIGFFTMIIFMRSYAHRERMTMIERGMDPGGIKEIFQNRSRRERDPHRPIRFGFMAVGVGIGLFVGNFLRSIPFFDRGGTVAGLVFICGGLGLLAGYFTAYGMKKGDAQNDKHTDMSDDGDPII